MTAGAKTIREERVVNAVHLRRGRAWSNRLRIVQRSKRGNSESKKGEHRGRPKEKMFMETVDVENFSIMDRLM